MVATYNIYWLQIRKIKANILKPVDVSFSVDLANFLLNIHKFKLRGKLSNFFSIESLPIYCTYKYHYECKIIQNINYQSSQVTALLEYIEFGWLFYYSNIDLYIFHLNEL